MSPHLSPVLLNALADGELSRSELKGVNEHLAKCTACTSSALAHALLKSATAQAGLRHQPSRQFMERAANLAQKENTASFRARCRKAMLAMIESRVAAWATAAALLLILGGVLLFGRVWDRSRSETGNFAALVTEVCDQHITTLAANSPPQVISSDRHTVKPWFQGKLPFSFNLPEVLPSGAKLEGADLTYVHNEPAALLLYRIGNHRVSVFVRKRKNERDERSAEHSGFHVTRFAAGDLDLTAVSDVDPARLAELVNALRRAQDKAEQESR